MAKATKTTLPVVTPPFKVTLELSQDEAETIRAICNRIGGSTKASPRKHMSAISEALDTVFTDSRAWGDVEYLISTQNRAIHFNNYEA